MRLKKHIRSRNAHGGLRANWLLAAEVCLLWQRDHTPVLWLFWCQVIAHNGVSASL